MPSAGRLAGKRAFVTGAGQGIGRAIALRFAQEGASVVAASRTPAKMADLPRQHASIKPVALDLTDVAALQSAMGAAGEIDILVNCAGWVANGDILSTTEADWVASFAQNVTPAFHAIREMLPGMIARRQGSIVNVASVASSVVGVPGRAAYGASKASLIGLTKAVARDAIAWGVRCNALCPGTVDTPSLGERIAASADPEATRRSFVSRQPIGRLGTADEIAAGAVFLASDESAFMTGQLLVMDGGQSL
jgi:2-keto-3-deoxy-L-fuconate dehydrogenase